NSPPRSVPRVISWLGTRERLCRFAPALARVAPGTAPPRVQQSLALRVEMKKTQDLAPLGQVQGMVAADELVVGHAAVGEDHGAPRLGPHSRAEPPPLAHSQSIAQV